MNDGLDRAQQVIAARGAAAQLCVIQRGRTLVDAAFGCAPDALFWIFSASKPFPAVLIHLLAEQGRLDLDDPVATWWPAFAAHGKATITIRQVLQHRTGMPTGGSGLGDIIAMTDWQRSVRRIERARPRWAPGAVPAYQFLSYGFILGEIIARVTGTPFRDHLAARLLQPLGLTDTHLGLPDAQWSRHVPVNADGPLGVAVTAVLNRRSTRQAVIPSAGISTTARDLAAFYQALLTVGASSTGILRPQTLATAVRCSSDGEHDRYARAPIRWAQGFQLGGLRGDPRAAGPMGARSSPRTFGHNGSNCCIAWADPDRDLVVAYLSNRLSRPKSAINHLADIADTITEACDTRAGADPNS